jgi:hypothetical protein
MDKSPVCYWICGKSVALGTCKTDEHGLAVHEECYTCRIALTLNSVQPRPVLGPRRLGQINRAKGA